MYEIYLINCIFFVADGGDGSAIKKTHLYFNLISFL